MPQKIILACLALVAFAAYVVPTVASAAGKYTTHPSQTTVSISKVAFKRITGSSFCPGEGFFDMAFLLTEESTGGAVYVD